MPSLVRKIPTFLIVVTTWACLIQAGLIQGCLGPGGNGGVQLVVHHARLPATLKNAELLPDVLKVESFRVVISGSDFSPPIEVLFPGDASGGTISGIPVGEDRTIRIEALNSGAQVVRSREVTGISISGGEPTPVQATLLSVPWVTNIANNSIVTNSRLSFEGIAEPGSAVTVTDRFNGLDLSLSDLQGAASLDQAEPIRPSLSDGKFFFHPPLLAPGLHTFEFRDPQTGAASSLTVTLVPPGRMPGTFLGFGGGMDARWGVSLGQDSTDVIQALGPIQVLGPL